MIVDGVQYRTADAFRLSRLHLYPMWTPCIPYFQPIRPADPAHHGQHGDDRGTAVEAIHLSRYGGSWPG
jgi:hypothetical protein